MKLKTFAAAAFAAFAIWALVASATQLYRFNHPPVVEPDPRVANLEGQVRELTSLVKDLASCIQNDASTNALLARQLSDILVVQSAQDTAFRELVLDHIGNTNIHRLTPATPRAMTYQQPVRTATIQGIPAAVYSQIAADAARKWPGDYDMQEFTIGEQVKSYKKLRSP